VVLKLSDNIVSYAEPKGYDNFVNLHLHTAYSLLDGMSKPEDVIKKVATLKQTAVAVTEHGNVFSAVKIHKLAKKENIKHIYGMEAYITEDRFVKNKDKKYYHLTLLAKNEQGRLNLNKLASLGYIEGFYSKPRIDHKLLKKYSEGIIVLSGCMASELQQALAGGKIGDNEDVIITEENIANAKKIIKWYREVFGEDYYLEVQAHHDKRQQKLNRAIVDLAKEFGIDYVATTDSHFVEEDDFELHSIFIQIGQNREAGETYNDTFIMSAKEVYDRLHSLTPEEREIAIKNSLKIADKCNVNLPLSEPIIPHVPIPDEFENEQEYLKHLINEGWKRREIHKKPKEEREKYKQRLMYEFNAISKMGFEGYFLLVHSYVNSVRRRGIARGSAGGSLVSYLIGITEIDPIPYGLYFERFIDVSALGLLEEGKITRKELKIPDCA
jgi:DNA polymerase III subunit alpha